MSKDTPKPKNGTVAGDAQTWERDLIDNTTGRVKFDDRGNAVWEWAVTTGAFGAEVSTAQLKKLENPTLSLADDSAPTALGIVKANPKGVTQGYSPYDSGLLVKKEPARKKDLRRLSEWLKLRKQVGSNNPDED